MPAKSFAKRRLFASRRAAGLSRLMARGKAGIRARVFSGVFEHKRPGKNYREDEGHIDTCF
jgi:hypothetical protein